MNPFFVSEYGHLIFETKSGILDTVHKRGPCFHGPFLFCLTQGAAPAGKRSSRSKGAISIVKDNLGALEEDKHVRVMGMARIGELERDRDEISARPIDLWPLVDPGARGVAAGQFDHFDVPAQVERNEVTG